MGRNRPYKWIRISHGHWEMLHRHNYVKHVGPVPRDMYVTFKDGNPLNCDPSNLTLVAIPVHMSRNTIARFPPELQSAIRLQAKFKRKLKEYEKQD